MPRKIKKSRTHVQETSSKFEIAEPFFASRQNHAG
jgi:hypothetical protein